VLGIAKFPKPDDVRDIAAGEILALGLAMAAGINTAEHRLVSVGKRSVAVITRFDRKGAKRIPFISAATLLGVSAGEPGSYTHMADGIRQFGHEVAGDLRELWRRRVFSLLVSNYDDHLSNHGFLLVEPVRWALAPAYDVNPAPEIDRAQTNKTPITEESGELSIETAMAAAARFGLKPSEAKAILREVFKSVVPWRVVGRKLRLKASVLDAYESAFEHPLLAEAKARVG